MNYYYTNFYIYVLHIFILFLVRRASELEIENEKLHRDILLLRNSINRGIADKELEGINIFMVYCYHYYLS